MTRIPVLLLAAAALGCGTRSTGDVSALIGPAGGSLAVTDSRSPLFGVRVEVPAGALAAPAMLTLREGPDPTSLKALPGGLAAFEPVAELVTDATFRKPVRLVFPIRAAQLGIDRAPSGFHLDGASGAWKLVLAAAIEGDTFSVESLQPGTWRWGVTLLDTVEYATLEPAMAAIEGAAAWNDEKAAFQREFQTRAGSLGHAEQWTDCDGLKVIAGILADVRDATSHSMEQTLATACGGCDATSSVFVQELMKYFEAKALEQIGDLVIDMADLPFLLDLYTRLRSAIYIHNLLEQLTCDYECLVHTPPPGFWPDVATYCACNVALVGIAIGADMTGCQLRP